MAENKSRRQTQRTIVHQSSVLVCFHVFTFTHSRFLIPVLSSAASSFQPRPPIGTAHGQQHRTRSLRRICTVRSRISTPPQRTVGERGAKGLCRYQQGGIDDDERFPSVKPSCPSGLELGSYNCQASNYIIK